MRFLAKDLADIMGGTLYGDGEAVVENIVRDNREATRNSAFFAIRGARFDGNDFLEDTLKNGASVAVGQRGFTPESGAGITVPDSIKAMGKVAEHLCREFQGPIVAVTGSVGKTTTKDMIDCAIKSRFSTHKTPGNYNNDIGLPLTVFGAPEGTEAMILEMGMNHAGELSYLTSIAKPDIAVITNIGLCHIENLGSQENILKAKLEILEGLGADGVAILNADDPYLWSVRESLHVHTLYYGMENKEADLFGRADGDILYVGDTAIHMPIPGVHNMMNALSALLVAKHLGISQEDAAKGVESFVSSGDRQNMLTTHSGALLLSDCYNASPAAVKASLKVLMGLPKPRKIAVLGDMFELGDYAPCAHFETGCEVARLGVDILLTVGELSLETARGAKESGMAESQVIAVSTNEEAILWLEENITEKDALLVKGSHGMHMETISNKLAR